MEPRTGHIKILTVLSLAATDTREDTLASVLLTTLYDLGSITKEELSFYIKENFGFDPYAEELDRLIKKLVEEFKIVKTSSGALQLSADEQKGRKKAEINLRDKDKARYQNFQAFLVEEKGYNTLTNQQVKKLWSVFIEYIYNNFFDYGEEALKRLHPQIEYTIKFDKEDDYFQIAFGMLKDINLNKIFRECVEQFPDYASQNDIDFLNDLAQKTLSFASLGIDPKLAESTLDFSLIDWVLYLDTNVLYSILNLHAHPENGATRALIQLIHDNKEHINIKLRYSELTKKELNKKRDDFSFLNEKLTDSGIRALLKSDGLDDFSEQYYRNLLRNRQATMHPADIIGISEMLLLTEAKVGISRNHKRVDQLGEAYLNLRIQDYRNYIERKNEIKGEVFKGKRFLFKPIIKSDKQIEHDITLRELILNLRENVRKSTEDYVSFDSIKYFGLTLDGLLRDFDTSQTRGALDEKSFPVFFRPSYLLNKLVRILPIKTPDYKKAFLKAVTSKGFNKDLRKSRDILKVASFLKDQGIDDEKVIYNMVSEDIFLERYQNKGLTKDFNEEEFFESELNSQFRVREQELVAIRTALEEQSAITSETTTKYKQLQGKESRVEEELDVYKRSLSKLQSDFHKLENRQGSDQSSQSVINFEAEQAKNELNVTRRELRSQINEQIKVFLDGKISKWKKNIWWNLLWVLPLTIFSLVLILFPNDFLSGVTMDKTSIRTILALFLFLGDGIFLYLIRSRYWDEGNKQKKRENIEIPEELISKQREYE